MSQGYPSQPGGPKGLADDGKRFPSDGCCILISSEAKGGGLEEGGLGVSAGGSFLCVFPVFLFVFIST